MTAILGALLAVWRAVGGADLGRHHGDEVMRSWASSVSAIVCVLSVVLSAVLLFHLDDGVCPEPYRRAGSLQEPASPTAVISPLPSEVSNGTFWYLDASASLPSDSDGIIVNYTWEILFKPEETTQYLHAKKELFRFSQLGLYMITLTVRDDLSLTDLTFTAVYAILDSDADGLPDWWETHYFLSLSETGSGDSDDDGWTNLQEYANGLDPTVKDPRPGLIQELKKNWYYLVVIAAAVVAAILLMLPVLKRKRKEEEKKKIQAALEIEKALEEK